MSDTEDFRKKLLIELYNQLWMSINTRLNLTWAAIGTLVSSFAIFALTEKNVISLDVATALIVLISGWFMAHVIDMSFSNNRNMVMISNIERQFLAVEDARLLYPYFLSHRKKNKMVRYLLIQFWLGIGLCTLVTGVQFIHNVLPVILGQTAFSSIEILIPYLALVVIVISLLRLKSGRDKEYAALIKTPLEKISLPKLYSWAFLICCRIFTVKYDLRGYSLAR